MELDPVIAVPDGRMPPAAPGPFSAEFIDTSGKTLSSADFEVREAVGDDRGERTGRGIFVVPIPEPGPDAVALKITRNGKTLATKKASAHPSEVEITEPVAGTTLSGDEVTIRWTGTDADGDALTYTVMRKDTEGWRTLTVGTSDTELEVFLDELGDGSDTIIRVVASDGFHSTVAETSGLLIEGN